MALSPETRPSARKSRCAGAFWLAGAAARSNTLLRWQTAGRPGRHNCRPLCRTMCGTAQRRRLLLLAFSLRLRRPRARRPQWRLSSTPAPPSTSSCACWVVRLAPPPRLRLRLVRRRRRATATPAVDVRACRSPGSVAQEDWRGHREGDGQGLEGPARDGEADRAEPHCQGVRHPLSVRAGHQGAEGAAA